MLRTAGLSALEAARRRSLPCGRQRTDRNRCRACAARRMHGCWASPPSAPSSAWLPFAVSSLSKTPGMAIHVALGHLTRCRQDRLVKPGPQVVRMRPACHSRTRVPSHLQRIQPALHFINRRQVPLADHRVQVHHRSGRRDGGVQPFGPLPGAAGRERPLSMGRRPAARTGFCLVAAARPPLPRACLDRSSREPRRTIDFLVDIYRMRQRDIATPSPPHGLRTGPSNPSPQCRGAMNPAAAADGS